MQNTIRQRNSKIAQNQKTSTSELVPPQSPDGVEQRTMTLLTPLLGRKYAKMVVRSISAIIMVGFMCGILWQGHLAMAGFFVSILVALFSELVNVRYVKAKEAEIPLFRTVQWSWFGVAMFYAYGSSFLKAPLGLSQWLPWLQADQVTPVFGTVGQFHQWASFSLYALVFVVTVLSLKKGFYRYQITQMSWTFLALLLTVLQMKSVVFNIAQGLFWVVFPMMLVIINDTMAYFVGITARKRVFGKDTVFMALSPNKTWEGFIGGGICTVILGFYLPKYLGTYNKLTCTFEQAQQLESAGVLADGSHMHCGELHGSVFLEQPNLWGIGFTASPAQLHGVALGMFASLVAPFGGFFASAVKRAYKLDDFSDLIPGHGGFMDRLDCQFIMALCTNVHYTVFIAAPVPSFAAVISAVGTMTPDLRRELMAHLQELGTDCETN